MMDPTNPYTVGFYDTYDKPHAPGPLGQGLVGGMRKTHIITPHDKAGGLHSILRWNSFVGCPLRFPVHQVDKIEAGPTLVEVEAESFGMRTFYIAKGKLQCLFVLPDIASGNPERRKAFSVGPGPRYQVRTIFLRFGRDPLAIAELKWIAYRIRDQIQCTYTIGKAESIAS